MRRAKIEVTEAELDEYVRLYESGLSYRKLAERVGRSHDWLRKAIGYRVTPHPPSFRGRPNHPPEVVRAVRAERARGDKYKDIAARHDCSIPWAWSVANGFARTEVT